MIAPMTNWNPQPTRRHIRPRRKRRRRLRFSPTAWAKLLFLRDAGPTEIGGFGITDPDDPLHVIEFVTLRQACTPTTVDFAEDAIADFVDEQADLGRPPAQCLRVWIHTHPGSCPRPSQTDEETFRNVFGESDWSVMFIVACGGACYGRLQCNTGPGITRPVSHTIDYRSAFDGADHDAWLAEYDANVQIADPFQLRERTGHFGRQETYDSIEIESATSSQWVAS